MTNLETRIAEALNDKDAKPSAFSDLLIEIHDALPLNAKALEAAQVRMVRPWQSVPRPSQKDGGNHDFGASALGSGTADPAEVLRAS